MVFLILFFFLSFVPAQVQAGQVEQTGENLKGNFKEEVERELLTFKERLTLLKESGFENSVLFSPPSSPLKREKEKVNPYLLFKERKELLWKLGRKGS